jgi:hypothetical protein
VLSVVVRFQEGHPCCQRPPERVRCLAHEGIAASTFRSSDGRFVGPPRSTMTSRTAVRTTASSKMTGQVAGSGSQASERHGHYWIRWATLSIRRLQKAPAIRVMPPTRES